ncbi:DUF4176 domain-containing protein [Bacillus sp. CLL-7-23]|uniref:DUF4176 domain-containing protein n=1 Tax=Bacillus changyiensis TaxID=3004103 RepID=A0ABT4WYT4_9BACI|nr:DUF4176 domain-containing protein [Bacillus changyiensis]MDA7025200.1 DUF4176 domain-containing protein [Bacillus changyiensis]
MLFKKNYLSVGSVVGLNNDSRRLLVIGRQMFSETNNIIRDYAAVEYPNGFTDPKEQLVLFDKDDIDLVYHYGYVDQREMLLDELLTDAEERNIMKEK